ncbi:MAG: Gfo/Idh/MocA family oxidoreductase [Candidatus Hydrogenedentes bacterium]|nr:Gfo/Idh/MocA family oxidoreductase [Candidatus Hydrogenedentota bacterium]
MSESKEQRLNRRGFLKQTAGTAGLVLVAAGSARGAEANSKLQIGVLGCGGRGPWIGNHFQEQTNTKVIALHDYFEDQVQSAAQRLEVDASGLYTGLDGYKEMLAREDIDAVAIISPPYFHPDQVVAALEAGKHVYLAKPIAVDVPGCMAIVEAANKHQDKLNTFVDFQTRNNEFFREAAKRVHEGMIGAPVCGQTFYHTGRLGIKSPPGTEVARMRNWVFDKALSGDIIVEQNVHVLDVSNWLLQGHPIEAVGTGGRKARIDVGDCWDHFIVTYRYPNDVLMDFSSTQFNVGFDDLCTRIFGVEGTVETHYGGDVFIKDKKGGWPGGATSTIYQDGAINNIKDFCASIANGQVINNAQESANSTMTGILGRMAAYEGRPVTWDEMVSRNEKLDANLILPEDGPKTPRRG